MPTVRSKVDQGLEGFRAPFPVAIGRLTAGAGVGGGAAPAPAPVVVGAAGVVDGLSQPMTRDARTGIARARRIFMEAPGASR
jgi:hypothetical protein